MSARLIITFQKSFSKLDFSSFETLSEALAMFSDDIEAAKGQYLLASDNDINDDLENGDLVVTDELTQNGNGFQKTFIFSDKRWDQIKDEPLDTLPAGIGWTRTVEKAHYIISETGIPDANDYAKRVCDNCQTIFNNEAKEVFPV